MKLDRKMGLSSLPASSSRATPCAQEWSSEGRSITFLNRVKNVPNVWSQPLDGGPPKQITDFRSSLWLYNYALSADGKQIAAARGELFNDIVLIKDFR